MLKTGAVNITQNALGVSRIISIYIYIYIYTALTDFVVNNKLNNYILNYNLRKQFYCFVLVELLLLRENVLGFDPASGGLMHDIKMSLK